MPWYLIGFDRAKMEHGKGDDIERLAQSIWESNGNPIDFALFGTHKIGEPNNLITLYYLSPQGHKYCSDGILIGLKPRVLKEHEKPVREGLRVIVGDPGALQLLTST
jgi:hypothetical protein